MLKFNLIKILLTQRILKGVLFMVLSALPSGYSSQFSVSASGPSADAALPDRDIYTATLSQVLPISRGNVRSFDLYIKVSTYFSFSVLMNRRVAMF